ncbi:hypothetical protein APHAL10511_000884 [Amanita phalloides]|nr:hypothetical protein APHAL10511_000884 [Amanita phalloides]
MLKPILTASTATLNNNTDISTPKTIETNTTDGNSQPDMVKGAPTMDAPSSVMSNVSTTGSSPSISMSVMRDKQPRPRPLTLSLKLPPNLPKDDAASSSQASDAPANDEPCPRPPQDVNKVNPITTAGASILELAPANTSSGTSGKGKPKAAARKGKKAVKEYIVDPNSTAPKDLFTNNYLANPDNAEKTKAVDVLRAWKALSKEEDRAYTELSREMKSAKERIEEAGEEGGGEVEAAEVEWGGAEEAERNGGSRGEQKRNEGSRKGTGGAGERRGKQNGQRGAERGR